MIITINLTSGGGLINLLNTVYDMITLNILLYYKATTFLD